MSANHNQRRQAAVPDRATSSRQWGVQPDRAHSARQWGVQPDRAPSSSQWGVQPERAPSSRQPSYGVMGSGNRGPYPPYEVPLPQVGTDTGHYPSQMDNAMMQQLLEMKSSQEQLVHLLLDMRRQGQHQAKCIAAMQSTMERMQS